WNQVGTVYPVPQRRHENDRPPGKRVGQLFGHPPSTIVTLIGIRFGMAQKERLGLIGPSLDIRLKPDATETKRTYSISSPRPPVKAASGPTKYSISRSSSSSSGVGGGGGGGSSAGMRTWR